MASKWIAFAKVAKRRAFQFAVAKTGLLIVLEGIESVLQHKHIVFNIARWVKVQASTQYNH